MSPFHISKLIFGERLFCFSLNKKSVLFADGVAPGDGTSTSGGEDVVPMLRDRNKRMTKRKLDSKRRRARREASVIKKVTNFCPTFVIYCRLMCKHKLFTSLYIFPSNFAGNRSTSFRNYTVH